MIEDNIFKKARLDVNKIQNSGFKDLKDGFEIEKDLMDGVFKSIIKIDKKGLVRGKIYDTQNGEEYLLFRMKHQTGGYSSKVRDEYEDILRYILKKYFIENYFISPQANRITELIHKEYGVVPDFPWKGQKNASDAGVFRKTPDGKWFGLIMNVKKDKVIKKAEGTFDIINLKLGETEIQQLIQQKGFYPAYHMNKQYWITILLDDTLEDKIIMKYIKKSYKNIK